MLQAALVVVTAPEISNHTDGSWRHFRAEGLSLGEALPSAPSYIRKYFAKTSLAPDSIREMAEREGCIWQDDSPADDSAEILRLAFVGDIMWIRNNWDGFADPRLIERLAGYDMVFGNLETPVDTASAVKSLLPDYARYNSAPGLLRSFRRADGSGIFTAVSLANNHAFDMGVQGLRNTIGFLEREGIGYNGALPGDVESPDFLLLERNGIRIGFHAAGWGLNDPYVISRGDISMNLVPGLAPPGNQPPDASGIKKVLGLMDSAGIEIKIIYLHWGYEFELLPDPAVVRLGREIAEAGADLVIGSHPHVIQPVEIWPPQEADNRNQGRRSLIAWSLGNFTTAMYTKGCRTGMVLPVTLYRSVKNGTVEWIAPVPFNVINVADGFAGRNRKLLLCDDYISGK